MKRRNSVFLVLLISLSAVFASTAYYLTSPRATQPFIGWGVYSETGLSQYLPSNLTASIGQQFAWHFEISNHMGTIEFVRIIYRVGNLTSTPPNRTTPAEALPIIGMAEIFIRDLGTSRLDFTWRVTSIIQAGNLYPVFEINGEQVNSLIGAELGRDFRFFFELWTYEPSMQLFQYGWFDGTSRLGSWLQIGFNVAT